MREKGKKRMDERKEKRCINGKRKDV
jgi:hypothetical protein